ncbi:MAG: PEP-CTERM sorting domain-containing protein [Proteobacteria bacterium]|nr:PEP-CTERM sorting domain-containing protein [Pseudomonadota bacterium]
MSPVPEPENYALLLAGLGVLTVFARRPGAKLLEYVSVY